MNKIESFLREQVKAGIKLSEATDFFERQCEIAIDTRKDLLRFETGIFDYAKKPTFFFSLMRIFDTPEGQSVTLRLDIRFPPDTVNARFSRTASEQNEKSARERFFSTVKSSDSFSALKNARLGDFSIEIGHL